MDFESNQFEENYEVEPETTEDSYIKNVAKESGKAAAVGAAGIIGSAAALLLLGAIGSTYQLVLKRRAEKAKKEKESEPNPEPTEQ